MTGAFLYDGGGCRFPEIRGSFEQNQVKGVARWNQFKKRGVPGGWGSDWQGCQFLALIALRWRRRGCGGLFVIPFTLHKHRRHSAFVAHLSPRPAHRADGAC